MRYRFHTADVFTDRIFGGNPLAVITDARGLTGERMQSIAREFNLSETVFVLPPDDPRHTRRLRIFTPGRELPFAGHPTVGTAVVLVATGEVEMSGPETRIVLEEGVGPIPVVVSAIDGRPSYSRFTCARLPRRGPPPPDRARLAALLGLTAADVAPKPHAPAVFDAGVPFTYVPLRSRDAVARARVDHALWRDLLAGSFASQVYVFSFDTAGADADIHARMFAPGFGIAEDPATGSAAVALAGYLVETHAHDGPPPGARTGTIEWTIEQGLEMGRPSILELEADVHEGALTGVRLGGRTVLVSEGWLDAG